MRRQHRTRALKNEAAALLGLCDGPAYADQLERRIGRVSHIELCHGALQPALRSLCKKQLATPIESPVAELDRPTAHRRLKWYRVMEQGRAAAKELCRSIIGLTSLVGGLQ